MKIHPDIEDIGDIGRYCINCAFPMTMNKEGECTTIFMPATTIGRDQILGTMVNTKLEPTQHTMSLDTFLFLDTGPFKARMVETKEGSLVYVSNADANARHHGLVNYQVHAFWDQQPDLSGMSRPLHHVALELFNMHRTPWSLGAEQLAEGKRIGIALSDRFGVITSESSPNPQIVWKTYIIGEVIGERPSLEPRYSHLMRIVDTLLSK